MKIGWGIEDARTKGMRTDECRMDASVEPKKGRRERKTQGEKERDQWIRPLSKHRSSDIPSLLRRICNCR